MSRLKNQAAARGRRIRRLNLETMEARWLLAVTAVDDMFTTAEDTVFNSQPTGRLVAYDAQWDYLDQIRNDNLGAIPDDYPVDGSGNAWNSPAFNVNTSTIGPWGRGPGAFQSGGQINGFTPGNANFQGMTVGTAGLFGAVGGNNNTITTYLFRTEFTLAAAVPEIVATVLVDDSAIIYVDGNEVTRWNITADPVSTTDFAIDDNITDPATGNATITEDVTIALPFDASGIAPGTHSIAVEVHQHNFNSSDLGFALQLTVPGDVPILQNDNLSQQSGQLMISGDTQAVDSVTGNFAGDVVVNADGTFTFTPAADYHGTAQFDYTIQDDANASSATISIVVTPVDDPPAAADDTYIAGTGGTVQTVASFSGNAIIPAGSQWYYSELGEDMDFLTDDDFNPATPPQWLTKGYDPPNDFLANFAWSGPAPAQLGFGEGDEATVVSQFDSLQIQITTYYFQRGFSLANPGIPTLYINLKRDDGAAVYINGVEVIRNNLPGALGDPKVAFDDFASAAAPDDGQGFTLYAIPTTGLNLTAAGNSIAVEIHQNSATSSDVSFDLQMSNTAQQLGVLANDSDPEDGTTGLMALPLDTSDADSKGTLTLNADGTFTFVPADPNFNGQASFTYQVQDSTGNVDTATVTMLIGIQNDPPVANPDGPYNVLQAESVTAIANAPPPTVILPYDAQWDYLDQIQNDLNGAVPDDYPVDGSGNAWNDPDFNVGTSTIGPWGRGPGAFQGGGGINGFTQGNANYQNIMVGTPGLMGAVGNNSNTVTTYLFRTAFNLTSATSELFATFLVDDSAIIYIDGQEVARWNIMAGPVTTTDFAFDDNITDPATGAATITENITITVPIDASGLNVGMHTIAVELHQHNLNSSDMGFALQLSARPALPGLLDNDTDTEGDALTVIGIINGPQGGTVMFTADGGFTYESDGVFSGTDTFQYLVRDSFGNVSTGTATVNVADLPDPPVAADDTYTLNDPNGTLNALITDITGLPTATDPTDPASCLASGRLICEDSIWSYLDDGTDQGDAWIDVTFDDSGWRSGPAELGYGEGDEATEIRFGPNEDNTLNDANNKFITYYFRQEFATPAEPIEFLTLGMNLDDGAAAYLNGTEIARPRLAAGAIFSTLAADQGNEGVWDYFTVDPGLLNPVGENNVLAVEVHQTAVTSSDLTFNAELVFAARSPVSVLFNDRDPDPGATLVVTAVNGQAGNVGLPVVLPSGATLAINADGTFAYSGDGDPGSDTFTYTVSDGTFTDSATVTINIGNANDPPVANDDGPYTVSQGGSLTAFANPQTILPLNATWDYFDLLQNELGTSDDYPVDGSGNAWNEPAFDINSSSIGPWGTGPAGFAAGTIGGFDPADTDYVGVGVGTGGLFGIDAAPDTTSNLVTTYLFRTEFTLTEPTGWLLINALCDDGCVFYVDGQKVATWNISADPVTTLSLADTETPVNPSTGNADNSENFLVSLPFNASGLAVGTHTLAVELHQVTLTSSDAGFAASITQVPGLLENDTDFDPIMVVGVATQPQGGTVSVNPDGSFTYTSNGLFTGTDSFTYQVEDSGGNVVTATATVNVIPGVVGANGPQVMSVVRNAGMVDPPDRPSGPQPTSWAQQQAELYNITITFDQPVMADEGDFTLTNLGVNAPVDADSVITLTQAHVVVNGNTVTLDFGGLNAASRQLPNGVYQLEILPTLTNLAGDALDGDADGTPGGTFTITGNGAQSAGGNGLARLDADWNGDLQVTIFDFNVLVYWFNATSFPAYMDLNRDGGVSIFDFQRLASTFIRRLVFPTPLVGTLDQPLDGTVNQRVGGEDLDTDWNDQVVLERAVVPLQPPAPIKHAAVQDPMADDDDWNQDRLLDLLASDVARIRK